MKCLSWNCRGLGNPRAIRALRDLLRGENPQVVFLIETKLRGVEMERLKRSMGYANGVWVDSRGRAGGLALWWNGDVPVSVQSYSDYHIDAHIEEGPADKWWRVTGFYGHPEVCQRIESWNLLRVLSSRSDLPWVCFGDFNEITSNLEKEGGITKPQWLMENYRDAINFCGFMDLGYHGYAFTWQKRCVNGLLVKERLDRAWGTAAWRSLYPNASVHHLSSHASDHSPISLIINGNQLASWRRKKSFRFESWWAKEKAAEKVITEAWGSPQSVHGYAAVTERIKTSRVNLLKWNRESFGSTRRKIQEKRDRLQCIQSSPPDNSFKEEEMMLKEQIDRLLEIEEERWKQRARVQWLKEGDRNTRFFHAKATQRARRNFIHSLQDEDGRIHKDKEGMVRCAITYFQKLFKSDGLNAEAQAEIFRCLECRVTPDMNSELTKPFTAAEVWEALSQMHPTKAPGPDGMPALFYQKFWNIIGHDIVGATLSFLNNGSLYHKINYTHIVLIPKVKSPENMTQFRPISLCNVLYKIAAKVLANRLKLVLPHVISYNQSAFVPGRLITDNVLVAFELNHWINRKKSGREGFLSLKLDMSKAYDRVEWDFLKNMMIGLGFAQQWINLIMQCVTSVTYSVILNGEQHGYFSPERGLRQGDPLSPYLFLICAEGLSALFKKSEERRLLKGVAANRGGPRVTHLFFADDSLIFSSASENEGSEIKRILSTYSAASGQVINYQKSAVVFSRNTSPNLRQAITMNLGVVESESHDKYLGLPSILGRTKREVFNNLKERIGRKLQGWKERLLSRAGKEVLIKAVAQSIPTYVMSCFRLPNGLCDELTSLIRRFWWSNGIYWKRWDFMCKSKNFGGLGFREIKAFNMALLAKQAWRLVKYPNSLAASVLKAKYFPSSSFFEARCGSNASWSWRSICWARQILMRGCRWQVGRGRSISVWGENWLPAPPFKPEPHNQPSNPNLMVSDLIDWPARSWRVEVVDEVFSVHDASLIKQIPLRQFDDEDILVWHYSKNGNYSTNSGYHLAMDLKLWTSAPFPSSTSISAPIPFRRVWHCFIPNRVKHFIWRLWTDSLPMFCNLIKKGVQVAPECVVCGWHEETNVHVFYHCPFAARVWESVNSVNVSQCFSNASPSVWIEKALSSLSGPDFNLFAVILSNIWFNRNQVAHGEACFVPDRLGLQSKNLVDNFLQAHSNSQQGPFQSSSHSWKAPSDRFVKVNFDAGVSSESNCIGVGAVIRDPDGNFLAAFAKRAPLLLDVQMAEAFAMRWAILSARDAGFCRLEVEGDCLSVINAVQKEKETSSYTGSLVSDVRKMLAECLEWKVSFVRREGNAVAHCLAIFAKTIDDVVSWRDEAPEFLVPLLHSDVSLIS